MFSKILIANRGEIAARIARTTRRLGIRTIAVYSDADRNALHVELADEAYRLGPAPTDQSYLRADKILEVAKRSGAEAIHPGYGFLSENPEFVAACEAQDVVFIGPPVAAIRTMGLKDAAKRAMEDAGVPVVPGYHGDAQSPKELLAQAKRIGFPVLVKATAGGGGKGMRRVDTADDFAAALAGAQREAQASFGEDRVLIEKCLTQPRHIEIQVFADNHGNTVHLYERDCSLQRRHQKVIEEAPAPDMPPALRDAMGQAAVTAAKAIGYRGAGTVEFIADVSAGLREDRYYFMEMNTRLQVEHPVTEMVTGQDLVEWQLEVAAGGALPLDQDAIPLNGHAIEARIYAEDVSRGFLPATGRLIHLSAPSPSSWVRIDTGVCEGDEITPYYDPMIAKLVVHGANRSDAIGRMSRALEEFEVAGCTTNLGFLGALMCNSDFVSGDVDTGLIEHHLDELAHEEAISPPSLIVAALYAVGAMNLASSPASDPDPWATLTGWRQWSGARQFAHLDLEDQVLEVPVSFLPEGGCGVSLPQGEFVAHVVRRERTEVVIDIEDQVYAARIIETSRGIYVGTKGRLSFVGLPDRVVEDVAENDLRPEILAPLPGRVAHVTACAGLEVKQGEALLVLEAMKMEMTIEAPRDGKVQEVSVAAGEQVEEGVILLTLVAAED